MRTESRDLRLLGIPTDDNGTEFLWADVDGETVRVLSVPVFAHGVSRGSVVSAERLGDRLRFLKVIKASPGATVRCYASTENRASEIYDDRILRDANRLGLHVGPATVFDPEIVAFHVSARADLGTVTDYLNSLAREGVLRFWELGDPMQGDEGIGEEDESSSEAWELFHQLPVEGKTVNATMA